MMRIVNWIAGQARRAEVCVARSSNSSLMKHLDCKSTRSGEVKGPRPVHVFGLVGFHARGLQPIVDLIDLVVRILHEAHMKPLGIGDLACMVEIADSEHKTSVTRQYDVRVRWFGDATES